MTCWLEKYVNKHTWVGRVKIGWKNILPIDRRATFGYHGKKI